VSAYNQTVASITFRAVLGRRRALLFAIPALVLIGTAAVLRLTHPADPAWPTRILGSFGFSVVLPLTALIIGTTVLGAEIEDGSIIHVLATPVRRRAVVLTKYVVAVATTVVFACVPELLAGIIATGGLTRFAVGLFVGALAGAVIYNALFVSLSAATTRALAVGLLYVLLWEGVLANFTGGARVLSIGHYALAMAVAVAPGSGIDPGISLAAACVLGAVVTVAALVLAIRKLSAFSLRADAA